MRGYRARRSSVSTAELRAGRSGALAAHWGSLGGGIEMHELAVERDHRAPTISVVLVLQISALADANADFGSGW